jgi:putative membrane protein
MPTTGAVDRVDPDTRDEPPATGPDHDTVVPSSDEPWQRLDSRVVWVDAVMFLISLMPSILALVVFDVDFTDSAFGIWPLAVATFLGMYGAISDVFRWAKTRYRITDERVEQRVGWFVRKYRYVPRERIRSVDSTARLRHRVARLRVVHIGTGEAQPSFALDAVSEATFERLRRELLRVPPATTGIGATDTTERGDDPAEPAPAATETTIAELRWSWIFYNVINIWAFLVAAFMLWSAFWVLQIFNVDLRDVLRDVTDWDELGTGWAVAVATVGTFLIGVVGLGIGFVTDNWNFQLVRTTTADSTALLTRRGLLQTREVYRDDRRLRGIHTSEPLFWRWIGLTETEVISTGLAGWKAGQDSASTILPRTSIAFARQVAALVLPDGVVPLDAPLHPHPRAALYRKLVWAVTVPGTIAGLLAWLGATDAVADWLWLLPVALFPVTPALAVVAHRAQGHTLVGPYLVLRSGLSRRATTALQTRAVIGWKFRQSLLQRLLGLKTVGVSTAGGTRHYEAPDFAADEAVAFAVQASPEMFAAFLVDDTQA